MAMLKKIFHFFYGLFFWIAALFLVLAYGLIYLRLLGLINKDRKEIGWHGKKGWSRMLLWLSRVKVTVEGADNIDRQTNYIFAANHSSTADIIILCNAIPVPFDFVMDEELFRIPFLGTWARYAGDLPISRRHPKKALRDIKGVIDNLKAGHSIAYFPEGGRSRDGTLGTFKSGIGKLVNETGVMVVPVAIIGSHGLMPRRSIGLYPKPITVRFGSPMKFEPRTADTEISASVQQQVEKLFNS